MRLKFLLFMMLLAAVTTAQVKVVDASDGIEVPFASVISSDGRVLGLTDGDGLLPATASGEAGFSLQHIVYEPHKVTDEELAAGVIRLTPHVYGLSGVVVKGVARDFVRMRAYFRNYVYDEEGKNRTLTEGVVDYYVPTGKKGKKVTRVIRAQKEYSLKTKNGRDTVEYKELENEVKEVSGAGLSKKVNEDGWLMINDKEFASLKRSAAVDVINGKYWPKAVYRRNGDVTTLQVDMLANKKKHDYSFWGLKLLGITVSMYDVFVTETYRTKAAGSTYGYSDLLGRSLCVSGKIAGKMVRKHNEGKDIMLKMLSEAFFTEACYMSEEEAMADQKSTSTVEMTIPQYASKLSPAMEGLKAEVMRRCKK